VFSATTSSWRIRSAASWVNDGWPSWIVGAGSCHGARLRERPAHDVRPGVAEPTERLSATTSHRGRNFNERAAGSCGGTDSPELGVDLLALLRPGHRGGLRPVPCVPCRNDGRCGLRVYVARAVGLHRRRTFAAHQPTEFVLEMVWRQHAPARNGERRGNPRSRGMGRRRRAERRLSDVQHLRATAPSAPIAVGTPASSA
jgi:hypothetical protein